MLDENDIPLDLDLYRKSIEINLVGTFNVLSRAAAKFAKNEPDADGQRGVIITTASIAAYEGQNKQVAYASAKAGVVGMTLPAARDLAAYGIRVMCIAPGTFMTPAVAALPDAYKAQLTDVALFPKRLGIPNEYAKLVQHICENPYLNAETIRLDSGTRLTTVNR